MPCLKDKKAVIGARCRRGVAPRSQPSGSSSSPRSGRRSPTSTVRSSPPERARAAKARARAAVGDDHGQGGRHLPAAKALPDATNMAGIILDVNRLAARHKLAFTSIAPSAPTSPRPGTLPSRSVSIVQGRFANVSGFLGELRRLVRVRRGRLDARGRIYSDDEHQSHRGRDEVPERQGDRDDRGVHVPRPDGRRDTVHHPPVKHSVRRAGRSQQERIRNGQEAPTSRPPRRRSRRSSSPSPASPWSASAPSRARS